MNTKQIIKGSLLSGMLVLATFTSCKKDFLDINDNPNAPADVSVVELLPSAEAAIGHAVGNPLQIFGGLWGQYWTQSSSSSQYRRAEQYSPSSDDFDRLWQMLYSGALKDLKTIISKATAEGKPNYVACAKILQAYAYQALTDNFGDVPFSEALQEESGIITPRYDSQHNIYHGIINLAKEGIAAIDESSEALLPQSDDLLLHGDMNMWRKFGNTLLLRMHLRMSEVDAAEAQSGIAGLDSANAEFLGFGEEVKIDYFSEGGNTNPLLSEIVGLNNVQNLVASATCVDYMNTNSDPRVEVFYVPLATGVVGAPQGDYNLVPGTAISLPGTITGGNGSTDDLTAESALAPVKLMTGYESLFLQAEAAERGWLSGTAQTLYEDAITENFVSYGFPDTLAPLYYAQPSIDYALATNKIEAIITQKWAAMCGNQNDEAWIEWRRTGYPSFFVESVNSILAPGLFPQRFFYPNSEITRNPNCPGQPLINTRVWWDVN